MKVITINRHITSSDGIVTYTLMLINFIQRSEAWNIDSYSSGREIPSLLGNTKSDVCVQHKLLLDPTCPTTPELIPFCVYLRLILV